MVTTRHLVIVLGDQLSLRSAAFDDFDKARDVLWMAEVQEETEHVWCHKLRVAVFLAAMRHFRAELERRKLRVRYTEMPSRRELDRGATFGAILEQDVRELGPERLVVVHPGDHRVLSALLKVARELDIVLEVREDRHFYCTLEAFNQWAQARPTRLLMQSFYEHMRRRHRVLVDEDGKPEGGRFSWDADNRERFSPDKAGPVPALPRFEPDAISRAVLALVGERFQNNPGHASDLSVPVTRRHALASLRDFLDHRLAGFGPYEDAMHTAEPNLFHSRLSLPLNLKLLDPRECVSGAIERYRQGRAPLRSVEGFVRQILGWREFTRGIYWRRMPEYSEMNALGCGDRKVPQFFWDGRTDMNCARHALESVLAQGYSHHIQRLMVLGNFALLAGVHPRRFHDWHMAMYLDAVDWVSLPNALGMSQFGDGGVVGTKPYAASGNYINRMSNYCKTCRYDPSAALGADACPFNALYWDFLARHRTRLEANPRMKLPLANLARKPEDQLAALRARAQELQRKLDESETL